MTFTLRSLLILVAAIGCCGCGGYASRANPLGRLRPEAQAKADRELQAIRARWSEEELERVEDAEIRRLERLQKKIKLLKETTKPFDCSFQVSTGLIGLWFNCSDSIFVGDGFDTFGWTAGAYVFNYQIEMHGPIGRWPSSTQVVQFWWDPHYHKNIYAKF